MAWIKESICTVDTHTAGEPTRIVTSGLPPIPGQTMVEKLVYANAHLSWALRLLMLEPRGHENMFGAVLVPPCSPDADIGVIYIDNDHFEPMCGHGIIGATTAALETGIFEMVEPETVVILDTPAGLVRAHAHVRDGRVTSVSFDNVPAFVYRSDLELRVPEVGDLTVDVVFGGLFFIFVDAHQLKLELVPPNAALLADLGMRILVTANEQIEFHHPELPHIDRVYNVKFYVEPGSAGADSRNVVILGDHMVDRSPCGTGTSAEAALRHARGQLDVGGCFVTESIIGTRFTGQVVDVTQVGSGLHTFPAVIPRITGCAHITGFHQFVLDPEDPFPEGFRLRA